MRKFYLGLWIACALLITGCATDWNVDKTKGTGTLDMQSRFLNPSNGGQLVAPSAIQAGDILLSAANSITSVGIRALSFSPVSHASIYLGEGKVAEAVTSGIRISTMADFLNEQSSIVAFRDPRFQAVNMPPMRNFVDKT